MAEMSTLGAMQHTAQTGSAARGRILLGIAIAAAFASVILDRRTADSGGLWLIAGLWLFGLVAGAVGTWWTSGNSRRMTACVGSPLAFSAARSASEAMPLDGTIDHALVAGLVAGSMAFALLWLFRTIGRMNPDRANTPVRWRKTAEADLPFSAKVDGDCWQVRINREPRAARYTLLVNHEAVLDLTSWPQVWNPGAPSAT